MSVVSKFLENGLGTLLGNLFKSAVQEGLDIYINTKWGKYILTIKAVEDTTPPQEEGIFLYWFVSTEWGRLLFIVKPNENN